MVSQRMLQLGTARSVIRELFEYGKQRAFELLMQQKPGFDRYQSGCAGDDEDCGTCRFYRPGWKYEFCVFKECPYCPGKRTRKTHASMDK